MAGISPHRLKAITDTPSCDWLPNVRKPPPHTPPVLTLLGIYLYKPSFENKVKLDANLPTNAAIVGGMGYLEAKGLV